MKIALVVLNYNGNDDTLECLRSLLKISYPDPRIYVVDNGSDPPLREALGDLRTRVRLIENRENLGFTGGHNAALKLALSEGADQVLLLNNDTVVDPGFLEPLVRALNEDPGLGIVSPKIYFYGKDRVLWSYGARVDRLTGRSPHIGVDEYDSGQCDAIRDVDRVTGCAMLVRRDFLERVGALDDRFFAYAEEMDWCLRARRAGYRVAVVKESILWHKGHRSSGRIGRPFIGYLLARNHLLLLRKHSNYFFAGGSVALAYFALSLGSRLVRAPLDYSRACVRGVVDFWRGRFGRPPPDLLKAGV
jgi:GT2 family glycosyltransferase